MATLPSVVGILNATPDSFSDGGRFSNSEGPAAAIEHGLAMFAAGAKWVDVGGESTRPGAELVPDEIEIARTAPVVRALAHAGVPVSIDTRKAAVAAAAVAAGATMINDVSGGGFEPAILDVCAQSHATFVAMHMRGTPADMQTHTDYTNFIPELIDELAERLAAARQAGIAQDKLVADPGFGFAKTHAQNLELLRNLEQLHCLDVPLFVGLSRKSMIGKLTGEEEPRKRLPGSLAALTLAVAKGARFLRVHDVPESVQAIRVAGCILGN